LIAKIEESAYFAAFGNGAFHAVASLVNCRGMKLAIDWPGLIPAAGARAFTAIAGYGSFGRPRATAYYDAFFLRVQSTPQSIAN